MQVHLFSLLCDSPLCEHSTIYLSVFSMMVAQVVSSFLLLHLVLLWTILYLPVTMYESFSQMCVWEQNWWCDTQIFSFTRECQIIVFQYWVLSDFLICLHPMDVQIHGGVALHFPQCWWCWASVHVFISYMCISSFVQWLCMFSDTVLFFLDKPYCLE